MATSYIMKVKPLVSGSETYTNREILLRGKDARIGSKMTNILREDILNTYQSKVTESEEPYISVFNLVKGYIQGAFRRIANEKLYVMSEEEYEELASENLLEFMHIKNKAYINTILFDTDEDVRSEHIKFKNDLTEALAHVFTKNLKFNIALDLDDEELFKTQLNSDYQHFLSTKEEADKKYVFHIDLVTDLEALETYWDEHLVPKLLPKEDFLELMQYVKAKARLVIFENTKVFVAPMKR